MNYFKGVQSEIKRIEWPKGMELTKMTISVVQVCALFAILFILMDYVINFILRGIGA